MNIETFREDCFSTKESSGAGTRPSDPEIKGKVQDNIASIRKIERDVVTMYHIIGEKSFTVMNFFNYIRMACINLNYETFLFYRLICESVMKIMNDNMMIYIIMQGIQDWGVMRNIQAYWFEYWTQFLQKKGETGHLVYLCILYWTIEKSIFIHVLGKNSLFNWKDIKFKNSEFALIWIWYKLNDSKIKRYMKSVWYDFKKRIQTQTYGLACISFDKRKLGG